MLSVIITGKFFSKSELCRDNMEFGSKVCSGIWFGELKLSKIFFTEFYLQKTGVH